LTAHAQGLPQGPYLGIGAGANWAEDSDVKFGAKNKFEFDTGWVAAIEGGYAFSSGFRTGLEFSYRSNNVGKARGPGAGNAAGDFSSYNVMGNVYYDINTGTPFTPYIGGGAGVSFLYANDAGRIFSGTTLDGSDTQFAYQAIGGISYRFNPNIALTAEYRYFATLDPKIDLVGRTENAKTEYHNHAVLLGVRYTFAAPPPPPPEQTLTSAPAPAPAPAPAAATRDYLVFFDFDKASLTQTGRDVVATAAENAKRGAVTRIEVTGHTDLAGSAAYNMRLSQRRADAVKAELARLGIPASQVVTHAKGKSEPLVPTADGVREPSNRRVEIVFP
jgi:outer membrane protein OmpA-like peptidoglycan-associated protein